MTEESTIKEVLAKAGTSEWHMARTNPTIEDLVNERMALLEARAAAIQAAIVKVEQQYAQQLQDLDAQYQMCLTLMMPQRNES